MASPGGNSSSGTTSMTQIGNSSSETDLQQMVVMDERKRKRMLSNREAARRSRMRKQKHLDDLMAQVTNLRRENSQIMNTVNMTAQLLMNVEAENSVLRAQMVELGQRLESLDEILNLMNSFDGDGDGDGDGGVSVGDDSCLDYVASGSDLFMFNNNINTWNMNMNMGYLNQPIMASAAEFFQY